VALSRLQSGFSYFDTEVSTLQGMWEIRLEGHLSRLVRVSLVIPTLNEARNLPYVLGELPPNLYEVILVDGSSTDGTVEVARELYPKVKVVKQTGRGKGDALRAGFLASEGDIIAMIDGDGSMSPSELPSFVGALAQGADFVKGSRFLGEGGSEDITRVRQFGNSFLRGLVNSLYKTQYTDLCYGYIAFWRHCLPVILPDCDGFEVETLMNIRAATKGLNVAEVSSFEAERQYGESKLRAGSDGWRVLKLIFTEWVSGLRSGFGRGKARKPSRRQLSLVSAREDGLQAVSEWDSRAPLPERMMLSTAPREFPARSVPPGATSTPRQEWAVRLRPHEYPSTNIRHMPSPLPPAAREELRQYLTEPSR
jgi:hypothetical protein